MHRNPFVWEVQVLREVLDEEMASLRGLPYETWQNVIKTPISKVAKGRDNKPYRVRVTAEAMPDGSGDIRVTLSLARDSLLHRGLMRQSFVITANNIYRV